MNSIYYLTFKSTSKLKNQRNWLKQVWMLKFWSVINCIYVHWTKKLTLASNVVFLLYFLNSVVNYLFLIAFSLVLSSSFLLCSQLRVSFTSFDAVWRARVNFSRSHRLIMWFTAMCSSFSKKDCSTGVVLKGSWSYGWFKKHCRKSLLEV